MIVNTEQEHNEFGNDDGTVIMVSDHDLTPTILLWADSTNTPTPVFTHAALPFRASDLYPVPAVDLLALDEGGTCVAGMEITIGKEWGDLYRGDDDDSREVLRNLYEDALFAAGYALEGLECVDEGDYLL